MMHVHLLLPPSKGTGHWWCMRVGLPTLTNIGIGSVPGCLIHKTCLPSAAWGCLNSRPCGDYPRGS
ncbi:hypothetical protein JB92DRAFT_197486 [Gautieria morchelliformis]|nr:hypothetical protein JB92DRAFT_197486 [Gautieria morchelliformis]